MQAYIAIYLCDLAIKLQRTYKKGVHFLALLKGVAPTIHLILTALGSCLFAYIIFGLALQLDSRRSIPAFTPLLTVQPIIQSNYGSSPK